jgi:hypothetical protein
MTGGAAAAWWLERTDEECVAFAAAAARATRPDAAGFRAIAGRPSPGCATSATSTSIRRAS